MLPRPILLGLACVPADLRLGILKEARGAGAGGNQMKDADVAQVPQRRAFVVLLGTDNAERGREAGVKKHRSGQAHRSQHRGEHIELVGLPKELLEVAVERRMEWELTVSGGQLYLTTNGQSLSGELTRTPLVASD